MANTAAIISAYTGYIVLSFLPPLIWLLFYLHEDRHPEPKRLIVITFIAGIVSALVAVLIEVGVVGIPPFFAGLFGYFAPGLLMVPLVIFSVIALIEEYVKYLAVRISVLSRPEFDEPVDAMIYMVTAALGFAAIENVIFLIPVFEKSFEGGFGLTATRFVGANLLHALSSAIVGYFLARHSFKPWRKHAVFAGVVIASALHALFNYFIITKDAVPVSLILLILLLVLMAVTVFVDFERLKQRQARDEKTQPVS